MRADARPSEDCPDEAEFRLQDYRDVTDKFDRIVSVGMFEHVGVGFYDAFFRKCAQTARRRRRVAAAFDRALRRAQASPIPGSPNTFSLAAISRRSRKCCRRSSGPGLLVTDIEILRLHYAETLKAWRERFLAHREEVERLYDARFVRMWEFYLAASEMAFRRASMMVFQIQLTKRQGVVPMTRDYIVHESERLRALEGGQAPAAAARRRVSRRHSRDRPAGQAPRRQFSRSSRT